MSETVILSSIRQIREAVYEVLSYIKSKEALSKACEFDIMFTLNELLVNSLVHSGKANARLVYRYDAGFLCYTIIDFGGGFDHNKSRHTCPDVFSECGRGVFLVNSIADELRYNRKGNIVFVKMMCK